MNKSQTGLPYIRTKLVFLPNQKSFNEVLLTYMD